MARINMPMFQHDCNSCVFLGAYYSEYHSAICDLYYCPGQPTVIARYSDEPSDYSSGIIFRKDIDAIGEACKKAESLGYSLERRLI